MNLYEKEGQVDPNTQKCQFCSGEMFYKGSGVYLCEKCGEEYLTDFGQVKRYLEKNGPRTVMEIEKATGVNRRIIGDLINEGRVEVVATSHGQNFCLSCGMAIRSGQYCPACAKKIAGNR
ncbi:MAG: hypothetical protein J1F02_06915 [Lachnospiraceae bacterium]|nr:hypothetical protein [Lachnospiraceae bacterium]